MATPAKRTSAAKRTSKKTTSAARAVSDAAGGAASAVSDGAEAVTEAAQKATRTVAKAARQATASTRAVRAARAGRVEAAREMVEIENLDDGKAAKAVAKAEARHYQVEVNKRRMSVKALTKTLNDRWDNGWGLAHVFEQRGNTVMVFEKQD